MKDGPYQKALDISVAEMLDDVCMDVFKAIRRHDPISKLSVEPHVYDLIVEAKAAELRRGNAAVVLGLELVSDGNVGSRGYAIS